MENYTLLYIIVALFVLQFIVMRYYVQSSIEDNNSRNNKKIIKKLSGQISSTFDQYLGGSSEAHMRFQGHPSAMSSASRAHGNAMVGSAVSTERTGQRRPRVAGQHSRHTVDVDSIEDPAENIEDDEGQHQENETNE